LHLTGHSAQSRQRFVQLSSSATGRIRSITDLESIIYQSPNNQHKAELVYKDEIRFGPAYYSLIIDGKLLVNRIFGDHACWSKSSQYFAVQEWLSTDYAKGPITRVMLFEIENNCFVELSVLESGFVDKFSFEGKLFVYTREAKGITKEVEVDIEAVEQWKSISSIR
jgi:hypothetical protein